MKKYSGYTIVFSDFDRPDLISSKILTQTEFSEALSTREWKEKENEVFLIIVQGTLKTLCLARKGKFVVTGKYHVSFSQFVNIEPDITIEEIARTIPPHEREHFIAISRSGTGKLQETTWDSLIDSIKKLRPEIAKRIDHLIDSRLTKTYDDPNIEIESCKRDATIISIHISGIDLSKAQIKIKTPAGTSVPDFMKGLGNETPEKDGEKETESIDKPYRELYEGQMLEHDIKYLPGGISLPTTPDVNARFEYNGKILNIWNYNSYPIEQQLGVDLIYYHEYFDSYVAVQYKRLTKDKDGKLIYRLNDKAYKKELRNMERLESLLRNCDPPSEDNAADQVLDYRFHNGICYFKLCRPEAFGYSEREMIKGYYLPLDYWEKLIDSPRTDGEKGGKLMSKENIERDFNNTHFIYLVKNGLIGSKKHQSKLLKQIIKEILDNKRSLILAQFKKAPVK